LAQLGSKGIDRETIGIVTFDSHSDAEHRAAAEKGKRTQGDPALPSIADGTTSSSLPLDWAASPFSAPSAFAPGWSTGTDAGASSSPSTQSTVDAGGGSSISASLVAASVPSGGVVDGGALIPGYPPPMTDSSVGTSGSTALLADQLRSAFGVTGAGIKVGVLSDSFNDKGGYPGIFPAAHCPTTSLSFRT
jgi:hypothetical protein